MRLLFAEDDRDLSAAVKTLLERCAGDRKPFGRRVVGGEVLYRESESGIPV